MGGGLPPQGTVYRSSPQAFPPSIASGQYMPHAGLQSYPTPASPYFPGPAGGTAPLIRPIANGQWGGDHLGLASPQHASPHIDPKHYQCLLECRTQFNPPAQFSPGAKACYDGCRKFVSMLRAEQDATSVMKQQIADSAAQDAAIAPRIAATTGVANALLNGGAAAPAGSTPVVSAVSPVAANAAVPAPLAATPPVVAAAAAPAAAPAAAAAAAPLAATDPTALVPAAAAPASAGAAAPLVTPDAVAAAIAAATQIVGGSVPSGAAAQGAMGVMVGGPGGLGGGAGGGPGGGFGMVHPPGSPLPPSGPMAVSPGHAPPIIVLPGSEEGKKFIGAMKGAKLLQVRREKGTERKRGGREGGGGGGNILYCVLWV